MRKHEGDAIRPLRGLVAQLVERGAYRFVYTC